MLSFLWKAYYDKTLDLMCRLYQGQEGTRKENHSSRQLYVAVGMKEIF
jgi:hypothetical protein